MKRCVSLFFVAAVGLSLAGCSEDEAPDARVPSTPPIDAAPPDAAPPDAPGLDAAGIDAAP